MNEKMKEELARTFESINTIQWASERAEKLIEATINEFISQAKQEERNRIYKLLKKESFYYTNDDTGLEDKIIYFSDVDLIFNQN